MELLWMLSTFHGIEVSTARARKSNLGNAIENTEVLKHYTDVTRMSCMDW